MSPEFCPPSPVPLSGIAWTAAGGSGKTGLLVVGHGTADPVGADETRTVAHGLAAVLPGVPVELGFLEVITPSIDDAMRVLATHGCTRVVVAPLLLFTAGHARRDVPEAVREAAVVHGLAVTQSAAFGCHADIVALSRIRRSEALADRVPVPADRTVLLMVGRGSSDLDGVEQFRQFAAATVDDDVQIASRLEVGFVAASRPSLVEALAAAVAAWPARVVVQPHLLFRGHVEEQVTAAVAQCRADHPGIDWVQVPRLGPDQRVVAALADRVMEAAHRFR